MSKNIVFSFDDARADTYFNAWQTLKYYGLTGTINVVTDFVLHPEKYSEFASGENRAMIPSQLKECQQGGMELACHGSTHKNTVEDVLKNIEELSDMGLAVEKIGFASPHSHLTKENCADVMALVEKGFLSYIRSGVQVRREGLIYAGLSAVERKTHSKHLYYWLNRRNILPQRPGKFLLSVAVTRYTTLAQIQYLLSRMKDGESVILMFHSILRKSEDGYGVDTWYWDFDRFEALCKTIAQDNNFAVCNTKQLLS